MANKTKRELTLAEKVKQDNLYQQEIRKDAPSLYECLLANYLHENQQIDQLEDKYSIENQFYFHQTIDNYGADNQYIEKYIKFKEPKLNKLVYKMCEKYADNSGIITGDRQGHNKLQMTMSNRAMERQEIETLLALFIDQFASEHIQLLTDDNVELSFNVNPVTNSTRETVRHSNNELLKYIATLFEHNVMGVYFERKNKVKKFEQDGKDYRIILGLEVCSFEDIKVGGMDEEGNQLTLADVLSEDDRLENYKYQSTPEGKFIMENYADVMTKKQANLVANMLHKIKTGELDIDDLFHPVTGLIVGAGWARAFWPDRGDNIQTDIGKFFESVRGRMEKALNKQGRSLYSDKPEIRSTFARFPHLSMADNKLWTDYQVESKIKRKFDWEDNPIYANVKKWNEERIVDQSDVDRVEQKIMTVTELIDKYKLPKVVVEKTYYRLNEIQVEKKKNDM